MSFSLLGELNWLAVIVATIAYFALGGLWFMPRLFGDAWTKSIGWDADNVDAPGVSTYIGPLVTCFVATVSVAMLATAVDATSFGDGVVLGLVTGVGIAGAILFVTGYFDRTKPKPLQWFGIISGYHLVGLLIVAVIMSTWT